MSASRRANVESEGEFLWLVSLSDLMILLFVFFVVLFSFAYKNMKKTDFLRIKAALNNEELPKTPVDQVYETLQKKIDELKLKDSVSIKVENDTLVMEITEKILFESAEYKLKDLGINLSKIIARVLETVPPPYQLGVEGHTDDVPINTEFIEDNWELSSRRAHSILMAMQLNAQTLKRVVIMGYGEMRPLFANRSPAGEPIPVNQAKNRRVTVRIF